LAKTTIDADSFPQEILSEDEPKYLRRQKPLEIRRRKAGKKPLKTYLRVLFAVACIGTAGTAAYATSRYLRTAPALELVHADQIVITGNNHVTRPALLGIFAVDRGRSILRIPLEARRKQIESIPWVEHVSVRRDLPNRLTVDVQERVPIAFLRDDDGLSLIDIHGVTLSRPQSGNFNFPVIDGIHAGLPNDERERRMQMYSGFLSQIDAARSGASTQVSEVDLSDGHNLVATFSDLTGTVTNSTWDKSDGPLIVNFGDRNFQQRFSTLLDQIGQWRATVGRVGSVDLRFNGQIVVNPALNDSASAKSPKTLAAAHPPTEPLAEIPPPAPRADAPQPVAAKPAAASVKPAVAKSPVEKSPAEKHSMARATTKPPAAAPAKKSSAKVSPPLAAHHTHQRKRAVAHSKPSPAAKSPSTKNTKRHHSANSKSKDSEAAKDRKSAAKGTNGKGN
jgi:cell division protein FtsQ